MSAPEFYFESTATGFAPTALARGPWAEDMMHGRLLGGLAARSVERRFDTTWRVARLTVDLFRPAAMDEVTVSLEPVREGRKVQVIDAQLGCGGHVVGRVTAVLLPVAEDPSGRIWRPAPAAWPDPDSMSVSDDITGSSEVDGWLFRVVDGGMGTGERTRVWTNDTVQLVAGEPISPLVRAAVSGDIACPLANSSDQGLFFINADYTMLIGRYPVGDWIGLEVAQQMGADGIAIASATMVDRDGPFAISGGTSLTRPPLEM